jgi:hypothetical protein
LFLPGSDFRQFLLSEQARVGAVLERLAATETARPATLTLSVTPMTLPGLVASLFAVVAVLFVVTTRRRWSSAGLHAPRTTMALGAALLIQPFLFPTAGFVIASTLLFVVAANALRGGRLQAARVIGDVALGGVVAVVLYVAFSRGLGVQLPPFPL